MTPVGDTNQLYATVMYGCYCDSKDLIIGNIAFWTNTVDWAKWIQDSDEDTSEEIILENLERNAVHKWWWCELNWTDSESTIIHLDVAKEEYLFKKVI